jgi:hypothetical protein
MISEGEITAFTLDDSRKRFLIGDSKGRVRVINAIDGSRMKELMNHNDGEVISICMT